MLGIVSLSVPYLGFICGVISICLYAAAVLFVVVVVNIFGNGDFA